MVNAETVIALATGTVTEFQIWIIRISFSAHGTFMGVQLALLLLAYTAGLPAEVDRTAAGPGGHTADKVSAAEYEEVEHRHNRQQIQGEGIAENSHDEKQRVNNAVR